MDKVEITNNRVTPAKNIHQALLSRDQVPIKLSYGAKRTLDKLEEESQALQEFKTDTLQQYGKKDEDGELVIGEDGDVEFPDAETRQEYEDQINDLLESETSIDVHHVKLSDVGTYTVPPSWAVFIDFLFEGYDEEDRSFTGAQIETYCGALEDLLSETDDDPIEEQELPLGLTVPASVSYRNLNDVRSDINEQRLEVLKEHAETDDDGNLVNRVDDDGNETNRAKFPDDEAQEDFQEALNEEVYSKEYSVKVAKVNMDHVSGVNLPGQHIAVLDWMFTG